MRLALRLALGLALTILIEGALALVLVRRRRFLFVTALGNLLTNPALNLVLLLVLQANRACYWPALIALEIGAICVEALVFRALDGMALRRALPLALLLNGASYGLGALLFSMI